MIFPDVSIAFGSRRPFVFFDPWQVHAIDKIAYGHDSLSGHCAAVDGYHVPVGFGFDVGGWTFPACRNLAD
jgi:hypothetical protein